MKKALKYYITNECDGLERLEYTKDEFLRLISLEIKDYCQIADRNGMADNLSNFVVNVLRNNEFYLNINGYLYEVVYQTPNLQSPRCYKTEYSREKALEYIKQQRRKASVLDVYDAFGTLDTYTMNWLFRKQIKNVGDLLALTEEYLLTAKGVGKKRIPKIMKTINKVKEVLEEEHNGTNDN